MSNLFCSATEQITNVALIQNDGELHPVPLLIVHFVAFEQLPELAAGLECLADFEIQKRPLVFLASSVWLVFPRPVLAARFHPSGCDKYGTPFNWHDLFLRFKVQQKEGSV